MISTQNAPDPAHSISRYYRDSALAEQFLVRMRPFICPFAPLVEWVSPGSSVLDIGCGGGMWLLTLAESGRLSNGSGCDINRRALAQAKLAAQHYTKSGGIAKLDFLYAPTIADWPTTDQFDVVSLIDVLHHVPPEIQTEFVKQALKRLKPGGRLIYKDMACTPNWVALGNRIHDLVIARQWIHYLPIEQVVEVITQAGGSVLHRQNWRRLFYSHELLVVGT